jgi:hypothetical protein
MYDYWLMYSHGNCAYRQLPNGGGGREFRYSDAVRIFGSRDGRSCLSCNGREGPLKQLYGKSILTSWTLDVRTKGASGQAHRPQIHFEAVVYISTAGRLFTRGHTSRGGLSSQREFDPGVSRTRNGVMQASFSGKRLLIQRSYISGASQNAIEFDPDYRNCNASVTLGKQSGSPIVWRSSLNGSVYEIISSDVLSTSCAIRDGNALAEQ